MNRSVTARNAAKEIVHLLLEIDAYHFVGRSETRNLTEMMAEIIAREMKSPVASPSQVLSKPYKVSSAPAVLSPEVQAEAGEDFMKALKKAVDVRIDRRKQYGDTYRQDELLFLFFQASNKLKRFRLQLETKGVEEIVIDEKVAMDSLIDLVCYVVFAIENLDGKTQESV